MPFKIEAVYGYILKQPRIRFLLADPPDRKTIMAGLVLKELKLRGIVIPYGENLGEKNDQLITSMDFAKQDDKNAVFGALGSRDRG